MVGCFFKKVFSQKLFDFDVFLFQLLCNSDFIFLKMNFSYCKKKKKNDFAAIPEADSLCICI